MKEYDCTCGKESIGFNHIQKELHSSAQVVAAGIDGSSSAKDEERLVVHGGKIFKRTHPLAFADVALQLVHPPEEMGERLLH
jgi:hypothetical protein